MNAHGLRGDEPAPVGRTPTDRHSRAAAFRAVASRPGLRRVAIGFAGIGIGETIAQIALGVLAFRTEGVGGLGLLVAVQMIPSALLAPMLATLGDRLRREHLMLGCDVARLVIALAAALAAFEHAGQGVRLLVAMGLALAQSTFNPAQRSLVPLLVETPAELGAASVVTGTVTGIVQVAGPLLGGVVLVLAGASTALLVAAAAFAVAVLTDLGLPSSSGLAHRPSHGSRPGVRAGVHAALGDMRLRLVLGLFAAKNLGRGALNVLIILVPLELLGLSSASVGWLTAVAGAGGVVGGAVSATLMTRRRLSLVMAAGVAAWGVAFVLIGLAHDVPVTVAALVGLGIGNAVCDAAGYSLVPRSTRDDLLTRVYGVHESVRAIAIAAGGGATALVALHLGVRAALSTAGAALVLSASAACALRRHDSVVEIDPRVLELLRGVPLLGWMPPVGLERLASKLEPRELAQGDVLLREGNTGHRAYLIERGEVVVSTGGRELARLGPGDLVGEIALLRSVPRTATVVAATRLRVLALDRSEFLVAATGVPDAREAADGLIDERLAAQRA